MDTRPLRLALWLAAMLVAACAFGQATPGAVDPVGEAIRERVDHVRYLIEHDHRDHSIRGDRLVLGDVVARYYESQQFTPRWRDARRLDLLIAALADTYDDGLDPADYHIGALHAYRDELRAARVLPPVEQADLELLATDAMMLALYHLYLGKVDPEKLSPQWNFSSRPVSVERGFEYLTEALETGKIREAFAAARPQHVWYREGRERLREYRAIEAAGGWSAIADGPTIKPGMDDPRVPALRHRLRVTHDLPADAGPQSHPPDTGYDLELQRAVEAFQERHGLTPDAAVGPATREALNVPVAARVDQIRVNLERARWVLHEIKGEFVLVDVTGFRVSYFRDDVPVWTSKAIVGRPYRETPIFKSLITYVVFNPTWTIPPTILVKDKLPVIKRDPGYLQRNNIRVIDARGREIDPGSVNWSRYGASNLPPYQFRQDPGDDNALGLVKIMFPNPYLVYLHDTPSKSLFDKDERSFSSGCIRVQKAFELAQLVLNDPERWNTATMADVVASGRTQTVNLAEPVPVLLLYWTAQPRADGQVVFHRDIYGRDPPTLAALDGQFQPRP